MKKAGQKTGFFYLFFSLVHLSDYIAQNCNNHTIDGCNSPCHYVCHDRTKNNSGNCKPVDCYDLKGICIVNFFIHKIREDQDDTNRRQCAVQDIQPSAEVVVA